MPIGIFGNAKYHTGKYKSKYMFVEYHGTGALTKGTYVNYNSDYGTATSADPKRRWVVEAPSGTNNFDFAGIVMENVAADTNRSATNPKKIKICVEGHCEAQVLGTVTLGQVIGGVAKSSTAAEVGYFSHSSAGRVPRSRGSVIVEQSRTGAGSTQVYVIGEGIEYGQVEHLTLATGANSPMVGGVTLFAAGDIPTADATIALAAPTFHGQKKAFYCLGALTTNNVVITPASTARAVNGAAINAVTTVTLDGTGDFVDFEADTGLLWAFRSALYDGIS